ncbi:MAG: hypothetical protein P4L93_04080 [Coriobacteriia bacterium]|nr:hypothetical protein [Coriobacteriia bacterium]
MSDEEREILFAARQRAIDVLSASNTEARRVASDAEAKAVALLLEQQKRAESLIKQGQEDATEHVLSEDEKGALLESHRAAAEVLAATEQEVAATLGETKTNGAVDVLMAGQREAAAILLDAWMQVTEGRPPAGRRSRKE